MRSGFVMSVVLVAAVLVSVAPAMALQQVILRQSGDNTTNAQDPNNASQFSTDQSDGKTDSLGAFHFHVTSGSDWPGDPYRFYHAHTSNPDAYGSASTPGSEFSTSNTFYPH